ncbi:lipid-transfer protein [Nocardioides jensenii]|uniref:lipid-transfer protein n=1 Tax=Nocardioides jensenii TaxID=1843 RepID=UPI000830684F|nr:lipid-transfer protein [Nocardioides jensenii]
MRPVFVLGVAAHTWGKFPNKPQLQMATETLARAAADAGVKLADIEHLVAASSRFEGGMGWGLHANEILQASCESGASATNVGGGCAAGGIAVHSAAQSVASGEKEVVAAIGAERMPKGFIPRPPGAADDISDSDYLRWVGIGASNPVYWALEARRRMHEHGTARETYAKASVLMHENGTRNPLARYRAPCTVGAVLASPNVCDPLHLLEICAVSDGAAAVILGSEEAARRLGVPLVEVAGSAIATGQFGDPSIRVPTISQNVVSEDLRPPSTSEVAGAVEAALAQAGVERKDVDLIELADNTAWHVLAWPEQFGFLEPGEADWMLEHDELGIGGKLPINPSGGFLSFGEATTAQGVLQVCELTWQMRGQGAERQVPDARVGVSAVLGLGANGASIVLRARD